MAALDPSAILPSGKTTTRLTTYLIGAVLFFGVVGSLVFRITNGLDLSDEVYYASFVDDWLKGDIASSSFLVLHQTAALIVYPFAAIFVRLNGSTDGLFLFLRGTFLIFNVIAACFLFVYLRQITNKTCAFMAFLALVSFIPFGLPAPSYNTLGLQGLTVALAALGCSYAAITQRSRNIWMLGSAIAWSVTVVSYPTLILAIPPLLLFLPASTKDLCRARNQYGILVLVALLFGAGLLIGIFSWRKLYNSFLFLAAFNNSENLSHKLRVSKQIVTQDKKFFFMLVAAVAIGLARPLLNARLCSILVAGLFGYVLTLPVFPAGFLIRSHDAIVLAALTGLGMLIDLRQNVAPNRKIIAALYAVSLGAGLITAVTATNGLFNLAIGAAPAAMLAMTSFAPETQIRWPTILATFLFAVGLFVSSMSLYFGETPGSSEKRERITWGPAKGLDIPYREAAIINSVRDKVLPLLAVHDSLTVEGRYPGLGTLTPARTKALSVYVTPARTTVLSIYATYDPDAVSQILSRAQEFYEEPTNRPNWVVIYDDPTMVFINPLGAQFLVWYEEVANYPDPTGTLTIFHKRI